MDLYFMPLACSMATRISLYEAGVSATYVEIDPATKRTLDGQIDLRAVNELGLVPTLRTDEGDVLTENAAILQYVAERFPEAHLAPSSGLGRTRLRQWLCFIGTELHKGMFSILLDRRAPEPVKAYVLEKGKAALTYVDAHLRGHDWLTDDFSVADAYLATVLHWTLATPIKLADWPGLEAFFKRAAARPSVAKAFAEERVLYAAELAREKSSATAAP